MSTATLTPTDTPTTTKAPRYPWRTIRSNGTVNHYGSHANRTKGAARWSEADQEPVRMQRWTPDRGWHVDLTGHGAPDVDYAEPSPDGSDFGWLVDPLGWIKDGVAQPRCQTVSGLRTQYRCAGVSHNKTGYCLTHQHVYRRVNGIPEPPAPRQEVTVDTADTDNYLITDGPLTVDELRRMADGDLVTVDVVCPIEVIDEGSDTFGAYLGERVTGKPVPDLRYWANGNTNVYTVEIDLRAEQDPHDMLREARALTDGRARHRAVKRARDRIRAQRRRPTAVINLTIENQYELYPDVTSHVWHAVVPLPPAGDDAYATWEHDHLWQRTGTGRPNGDSWYSGTITHSTHPRLLDVTFT